MILSVIIAVICILIWSFPWQRLGERRVENAVTHLRSGLEYRLSSITTPSDTPVRAEVGRALDRILIQLLCLGELAALALFGVGVYQLFALDWHGIINLPSGLFWSQCVFRKLTNKCADYVEELDWE